MRVETRPLESARFGVKFASLQDVQDDRQQLASLLESADRSGTRVISTRVSGDRLDLVHMLEQAGFLLMDTLVYYRRELSGELVSHALPSDMRIAPATPGDADGIAAVAASAFQDYVGHYHADPRLSSPAADEAYVDWARRLVIKADPGSITLCGIVNGRVVAFINGSSRVGGGSEIILNGVHREAEGKGYYSALLSAYLEQAARRGDKHVIVSTQLQNIRVQRVWSRHGLELDQSYYTFHRWAD